MLMQSLNVRVLVIQIITWYGRLNNREKTSNNNGNKRVKFGNIGNSVGFLVNGCFEVKKRRHLSSFLHSSRIAAKRKQNVKFDSQKTWVHLRSAIFFLFFFFGKLLVSSFDNNRYCYSSSFLGYVLKKTFSG